MYLSLQNENQGSNMVVCSLRNKPLAVTSLALSSKLGWILLSLSKSGFESESLAMEEMAFKKKMEYSLDMLLLRLIFISVFRTH